MRPLIRRIVSKHIIVAGFLLFVIGSFFAGDLFPFDIENLENSSLFNWRISAMLRDAGVNLAASTIIISGLRSILLLGGNRRRVAMVLTGIGICVLFLALNCVARIQISKILNTYDFSNMISLIAHKLKQDNLPLKKRIILFRKLAESRYLQSGERIVIITEDNVKEVFNPPEETIRFKKMVDHSRKLYGLIKQRSRNSVFLWLGVLVLSIIVGGVTPVGYNVPYGEKLKND